MIVMKNNERLYLRSWEYNASRILTELAKVVVNHGGRVKPLKHALISDRTLSTTVRELQGKTVDLEEHQRMNYLEGRATVLKKYRDNLEKLESIDNDPIVVTHTTYITFTLDGFYYYYQLSDNPFFNFFYTKTHIVEGRYNANAYCTSDKKEWLHDCFFGYGCSQADIKEAANLLFNMLVNSKPSAVAVKKANYQKRYRDIDF